MISDPPVPKGVNMKKGFLLSVAAMASILLCFSWVVAAEKVSFEPVRAPSKGPDNAPVTIIEIADFM